MRPFLFFTRTFAITKALQAAAGDSNAKLEKANDTLRTGPVASGALVAVVALAAVHAASQGPGTPLEIDWRSSPLDLNLRGLNGERFRFRSVPLPAAKPAPGQVLGSGPYTDGSSIWRDLILAKGRDALNDHTTNSRSDPWQASK